MAMQQKLARSGDPSTQLSDQRTGRGSRRPKVTSIQPAIYIHSHTLSCLILTPPHCLGSLAVLFWERLQDARVPLSMSIAMQWHPWKPMMAQCITSCERVCMWQTTAGRHGQRPQDSSPARGPTWFPYALPRTDRCCSIRSQLLLEEWLVPHGSPQVIHSGSSLDVIDKSTSGIYISCVRLRNVREDVAEMLILVYWSCWLGCWSMNIRLRFPGTGKFNAIHMVRSDVATHFRILKSHWLKQS